MCIIIWKWFHSLTVWASGLSGLAKSAWNFDVPIVYSKMYCFKKLQYLLCCSEKVSSLHYHLPVHSGKAFRRFQITSYIIREGTCIISHGWVLQWMMLNMRQYVSDIKDESGRMAFHYLIPSVQENMPNVCKRRSSKIFEGGLKKAGEIARKEYRTLYSESSALILCWKYPGTEWDCSKSVLMSSIRCLNYMLARKERK